MATHHPENPRRNFLKTAAKGSVAALSLSSIAASAFAIEKNVDAETTSIPYKVDHKIRSTPENTVWGYYGYDVPPIATVKDGDVVEIQAVNVAGTSARDPEAFYKTNNLPLDEQALDIIAIYKNPKKEPSGLSGHMLTGPIFI